MVQQDFLMKETGFPHERNPDMLGTLVYELIVVCTVYMGRERVYVRPEVPCVSHDRIIS